jgi:hypothetical protein
MYDAHLALVLSFYSHLALWHAGLTLCTPFSYEHDYTIQTAAIVRVR